MANKTFKPGTGARDTDKMSKSELRDYHKEINEFMLENKWRTTLSYYSLSPTQASDITKKTRDKRDKEVDRVKSKRRKEREKKASAKGKKSSKRGRPSAESAAPKKRGPGRPKKETTDSTPKRGPGRPRKDSTAAPKKPGRPKKVRASSVDPDQLEEVLDFLLSYRAKGAKGASLEDAIIDLTSDVRAAQIKAA